MKRNILYTAVVAASLVSLTAFAGKTVPTSSVDAQGNVPARVQTGAGASGSAPACFELHNGSLVFYISVTFDISTYPYNITGGGITGSICGAGSWTVTGGNFGGSSANINANYSGTSCASSISVTGGFQEPSSYNGTYGFNGSNNSFGQTLLFQGFHSC